MDRARCGHLRSANWTGGRVQDRHPLMPLSVPCRGKCVEEALAGRCCTPESRLAREALREVAQRLDVLRRRDGVRLVVGLVVQHVLAHADRA